MKNTLSKVYKLDITINFASLLMSFVVSYIIKVYVVKSLPIFLFLVICFVFSTMFRQVLYVYFKKELKEAAAEVNKEFKNVTNSLIKDFKSKDNKTLP